MKWTLISKVNIYPNYIDTMGTYQRDLIDKIKLNKVIIFVNYFASVELLVDICTAMADVLYSCHKDPEIQPLENRTFKHINLFVTVGKLLGYYLFSIPSDYQTRPTSVKWYHYVYLAALAGMTSIITLFVQTNNTDVAYSNSFILNSGTSLLNTFATAISPIFMVSTMVNRERTRRFFIIMQNFDVQMAAMKNPINFEFHKWWLIYWAIIECTIMFVTTLTSVALMAYHMQSFWEKLVFFGTLEVYIGSYMVLGLSYAIHLTSVLLRWWKINRLLRQYPIEYNFLIIIEISL